jgi:hypothetical protein
LNPEVLRGFPFELSLDEVLQKLRMDERRSQMLGVGNVFKTATSLVHPQAVFTAAYVTKHGADKIEIDDVEFTSRVLAKNLEGIERVFAYVVTIGDALENKSRSSESVTEKLIFETVGDLALGSALEHVMKQISQQYALELVSHMGPGQLDWPITQQRQLFSIIGDVKGSVGVTLADSLMMIPRKSISGIIFPTKVTFISCQLCQRKNCPSRKASFDRDLAKKYRPVVKVTRG